MRIELTIVEFFALLFTCPDKFVKYSFAEISKSNINNKTIRLKIVVNNVRTYSAHKLPALMNLQSFIGTLCLYENRIYFTMWKIILYYIKT